MISTPFKSVQAQRFVCFLRVDYSVHARYIFKIVSSSQMVPLPRHKISGLLESEFICVGFKSSG